MAAEAGPQSGNFVVVQADEVAGDCAA